jgi:hypothetical protein
MPMHFTSSTSSTDYVRPTDWSSVPAPASNAINILAAVFPTGDNYAVLSVTVIGGYTVDWGDGTTEDVASATQANHQYTYADADLDGTLTTRGYKQAIVKITTQTLGASITTFDLGLKHTGFGASGGGSSPWLDMQINTPAATSITFRGGVESRLVEIINITSCGSVTTLASAWQNCSSLQSLTFPSGFGSAVTTLASAWSGCGSLQSLTFPSGFGSSIITTTTAFSTCGNLSHIENLAVPITFSVASCKLSGTELDSIYTALPAAVAQTITVTSNYGTSSDTPSIAEAKGWSVTG